MGGCGVGLALWTLPHSHTPIFSLTHQANPIQSNPFTYPPSLNSLIQALAGKVPTVPVVLDESAWPIVHGNVQVRFLGNDDAHCGDKMEGESEGGGVGPHL